MTRNNSRACFKHALTGLGSADAAVEMIADSFIFTGFTTERPPLIQLTSFVNLGSAVQAALYLVVVQHDAKVQFLRR